MTLDRRPDKLEERKDPSALHENEDKEDEEENEEGEYDTNGDNEGLTDDEGDLDEKIRTVRANDRQLEQEIANQDNQLLAAATMQEQFANAVEPSKNTGHPEGCFSRPTATRRFWCHWRHCS